MTSKTKSTNRIYCGILDASLCIAESTTAIMVACASIQLTQKSDRANNLASAGRRILRTMSLLGPVMFPEFI